MATFSTIAAINVSFEVNLAHPQVHKSLNSLYADAIPDMSSLFVDPTSWNDVLDTGDLLDEVRRIITEDLIAPTATNTLNAATVIRPLINLAVLRVHMIGGNPSRKLNKASLTAVMTEAIAKPRLSGVCIMIDTSHLHFDMRVPRDWRNWTQLGSTPFPAAPTPPPPLTAAQIATAVGGAITIPPPTSAGDVAAAVTAALTTAGIGVAAGPGGAGPTPASTASTAISTAAYTFNYRTLPGDVQLRYLAKINKTPLAGSTVRAPYHSGYLYNLDGDKLILADGTLFLLQFMDLKGFLRDPVKCLENTHSGIRQWYINFVQHCHDHGFYAHPIWCFRRNHGGNWGFTAGHDTDDDLPNQMSVPLTTMTQPIFRVLSSKGMFPADSSLNQIVQSCGGDGYQALKSCLFQSHPSFLDQPATLLSAYPKQRDLPMMKYFLLFREYLALRAFITDNVSTLASDFEMDLFISGTKHAAFLNRVTRDERRLSTNKHKYSGAQLPSTLQQFLMAPDSPALATIQADVNRGLSQARTNTTRRAAAPTATRVNQITIDEDVPEIEPIESADSVLTLDNDINLVDVPDNDYDRDLFHRYNRGIFAISSTPASASQQPCIVCGGPHRFDGCNVLQNTNFLRQHYIRSCQYLRREAGARNAAFPGAESQVPLPPPPQDASVSFVDIQPDGNDSDFDPDTDFQQGRV